jgi:hypothetical protein
MMNLRPAVLGFLILGAQGGDLLAQASPPLRPVLPVLDFPEPGLDDPAAYQGYQTRFYRDSKQNTVQIYLDPRGGRVVNLWADAANESAGFTVRDARGRPVRLTWGAEAAEVADVAVPSDSIPHRALEFRLEAEAPQIELGWFVLGSMRIERDFQYARRHLQPYTAPPFQVAEESLLVADVARLPLVERKRHLQILRAGRLAELRTRLFPTIVPPDSAAADTTLTVRISRPSLDNRNTLALELRIDPQRARVEVRRRSVTIRARSGTRVGFAVRVLTDAATLTPLQRDEIFNRDFLSFLERAKSAKDSAGQIRYRRLERQVRGVELLSTKEKLMAGLPNFATYFGRDMMLTALMMQPVWTAAMSEHVIASVLRKLGPRGDVSHEEALGGQAIRENAAVYDSLIRRHFRAAREGRRREAETRLEEARTILLSLQKTRENYHMIDDEFQLPVLVARYLGDSSVSPAQKQTFLFDSSDGRGSRLALLLREMALVAAWTRPYVDDSRPANLVSFPTRNPTHWRSASWRDSDAGYAGGRFAMDVNAIWAPQALQSIGVILTSLKAVGITAASLDSLAPGIGSTPLGEYHRDPALLRRAADTWRGARSHFVVTLAPEEIQRRLRAKLAWLPAQERSYWRKVMGEHGPLRDSLSFLALSLDGSGKPIPVVNTDPATGLFLGGSSKSDSLLLALAPFVQPYPVGLFVEGLGPLVANDAYASRHVWERFKADAYHSPRVVWGREVNLLLLGLANLTDSFDPVVRVALDRTLRAVEASGLGYNELWSYRIEEDRLLPIRYGTSSDVQLWNTTDLAVEFVLARLARAEEL